MTTKTRCGNFERSASNPEAWINGMDGVLCPDCGARAIAFVRGNDLYPRMKIRAHEPPEGVTPAPYAAHPRGAVLAAPADVESEPKKRGSRVRDRDGDTWRRGTTRWSCEAPVDGVRVHRAGRLPWFALDRMYGPLVLVEDGE